jgi:hypothetical protein
MLILMPAMVLLLCRSGMRAGSSSPRGVLAELDLSGNGRLVAKKNLVIKTQLR